MKKLLAVLLALTCSFGVAEAKKKKNTYVRLTTSYGSCVIRLYNETPKHRDNFIRLTEKGFYDSLMFHRVIRNFMIQGGDPESKYAIPGAVLGDGGPNYVVAAEFNPNLIHKKGVLAAARDNNPEKSSSSCQFYIVQGKTFTDEQLDMMQKKNGMTYTAEQREIYKTIGGTPHLDNNYTVYGEVVEGLDMIDKIAGVKTGPNDRPIDDVRMKVEVLKKYKEKKVKKKKKK